MKEMTAEEYEELEREIRELEFESMGYSSDEIRRMMTNHTYTDEELKDMSCIIL